MNARIAETSTPVRDGTDPGPGLSYGVAVIAGAVAAVLIAFASRYGYHRDELYFLAAARHLDWSYADQGPLTPLLARLMNAIDPGSLTVLRIPSALAAGATVLLTGLSAREFGGRARAQLIATSCAAVAVIVLFSGHTLSTTTFDLLDWTLVSWLVVRAVRTGADRLWLPVGLVLGIGLLNKPLPAFLGVALVVAIAAAGPRRLLRNRYVWSAAVIAVVLWSPWLIWQSAHGWPQLAVSRSIAAGNSTSSQPWWLVVPFQALLAGPLLAPVWIVGLVRVVRDRRFRFLAWTWVLLAVVFMVSGGKPYYLAGLLPMLLGAGAGPVDEWLSRGRGRARALWAVVAISGIVGATISLPILPADDAGPVVALNADVAETIGWPDLVQTVAGVAHALPAGSRPVIFTENYGEAGAIDRFGPAFGLPHAYSGHNAYGDWGPPPDGSAPVIVIGYEQDSLTARFRDCTIAAHIDNAAGIDNDERGEPVAVCAGPRQTWSQEWPHLTHLG